MNRIDKKFKELRAAGKKAFIAFITAGYPDLETTGKLILEFSKRQVDIIELGVPFSDPLADGKVIQESSYKALEKGASLSRILSLVARVRRQGVDTPICLMTYYNPVFCFGEKRLTEEALACGVDALIIPDLPPEEGKGFMDYAGKRGLLNICFISPTSSLERVKFICRIARGFIYYICVTGVTGERKELPAGMKEHIALIKRYTGKPLCTGFGISSSRQLKQVFSFADGAIVGSAIVRKISQNIGKANLVGKVADFVGSLRCTTE